MISFWEIFCVVLLLWLALFVASLPLALVLWCIRHKQEEPVAKWSRMTFSRVFKR